MSEANKEEKYNMSKDKEIFTQDALEKMEQNEKFAKNEELKRVIQETHDKAYEKAKILNND